MNQNASSEEVVIAFQKEAKGWHLGRYPGIDERAVMQQLIEAKRILLNVDLRASFNREYNRRRCSNCFPEKVINQQSINGLDVWLEELVTKPETLSHDVEFWNSNEVDNSKSNVPDSELLRIINNSYAYQESFIEMAAMELRKRKYDEGYIATTIRSNRNHFNNTRETSRGLTRWLKRFHLLLANGLIPILVKKKQAN
ncbi:MAG: hypothetical protein ABI169_15030 [Chitinophagaceae bacterium]